MQLRMYIFLTVLATVVLSLHAKKKVKKLQVGDQAPSFTLKDETGAYRSLEEFRGSNVLLYFYPHDDTPGCTTQACSVRDKKELYAEKHIVVIGINYDSPKSHAKFKKQYQLPFIILSDKKCKVAQAYGAYSGIPIVNRYFPRRIAFLIDKEGNVFKKMDNIDVTAFADEVLAEFEGLNTSSNLQ